MRVNNVSGVHYVFKTKGAEDGRVLPLPKMQLQHWLLALSQETDSSDQSGHSAKNFYSLFRLHICFNRTEKGEGKKTTTAGQ